MTRSRLTVAGLLIAAAVLFGIGTSYEASRESDHHDERTESVELGGHGEADESAETEANAGEGHEENEGEESEHRDTEDGEESERILGIDATHPAVITLGIVASLAAAAAVVFVRRRRVDLAVAASAGVFSALDVAEAIHALREDKTAIAILALVIAALHLGAAILATRLEPEPAASAAAAA